MRRSIEWLGDKGEARRYAAALILRELAENAPAVFNVHVRAFIDAVWNGLRDPKQLVREASVTALRVGCSLMQVAWHHLHGDFRLHGAVFKDRPSSQGAQCCMKMAVYPRQS